MSEAAQEPATGKDAIYEAIAEHVKDKTGKRVGKTGGHEIFDLVVAQIMATAAKDGALRFNLGFGSLRVKTYGKGSRQLPSGDTVEFGERQKLRYEEGVVTKELISNGGDLAKAEKVRGSRAKSGGKAAAKKSAPKATKEAKGKAAKAKAEEAPPEEEGDDDLELD